MTQMYQARKGNCTPEMETVARDEGIELSVLQGKIAAGEVIIPKNRTHDVHPVGIGSGLRTKVNANIGTSTDYASADKEVAKARAAVEAGADAIMDLSTGGDIKGNRLRIMTEVPAIIGTVPIYEAAIAVA